MNEAIDKIVVISSKLATICFKEILSCSLEEVENRKESLSSPSHAVTALFVNRRSNRQPELF